MIDFTKLDKELDRDWSNIDVAVAVIGEDLWNFRILKYQNYLEIGTLVFPRTITMYNSMRISSNKGVYSSLTRTAFLKMYWMDEGEPFKGIANINEETQFSDRLFVTMINKAELYATILMEERLEMIRTGKTPERKILENWRK